MNLKHANHPKDDSTGVIAWKRPTHYVVGDRMRRTVLFICEDYILEMTPENASLLANEILVHCRDVTPDKEGEVPSTVTTSAGEKP